MTLTTTTDIRVRCCHENKLYIKKKPGNLDYFFFPYRVDLVINNLDYFVVAAPGGTMRPVNFFELEKAKKKKSSTSAKEIYCGFLFFFFLLDRNNIFL